MLLPHGLSLPRLRNALDKILRFRDRDTQDHCLRVFALVSELGRTCGLSSTAAEIAEVAAQFHDIGKIGVPDAILLKAGPLTAAEFEVAKSHAVIGASIMEEIDAPDAHELTPLVLYHHERFDGAGYPEGLAGNDIPLGARVIAVVNAFDAMTSPRPYRDAFSREEALRTIERERGAQFDPRVVEIFLRLVR